MDLDSHCDERTKIFLQKSVAIFLYIRGVHFRYPVEVLDFSRFPVWTSSVFCVIVLQNYVPLSSET